mgnify:CR=1 FL=1
MALTKVIGNGLGAVTQDGGATFNEGSADVDFRVESNGLTNAFVVDGGNNGVGINATPRSDLHTTWSQMFIGQKGSIISERSSGGGIPGTKLTDNLYIDSDTGAAACLETNQASQITLEAGQLTYQSAVSASAGAAPTLVTHMNIDASGAMTKPLQPAFLATKSASQDNFAVGSGVTITFDTEVFDQNSDYNNSTNIFVAPVTGRYQLSFHIRMTTLDSASGYYYIQLVTSNRSYISIVDPDFGQDNGHFTFSTSNLADMDANDQAYIIVVQQNGTQQTDFTADSYFSGALIC